MESVLSYKYNYEEVTSVVDSGVYITICSIQPLQIVIFIKSDPSLHGMLMVVIDKRSGGTMHFLGGDMHY